MTAIPHWRVASQGNARQRRAVTNWSSSWYDGDGLRISASDGCAKFLFRLRFERGATFDVLPAERLIVASAHKDNVAQLTIDNLLSDQVEPRVLAYEGELIIHASAIEVDGTSILFVGDSGVGKSTLAASFDQSGTAMLCDDAVIVEWADGQATARALYPSLRLHPDSLAALYPDLQPSAAKAHHGLKRRLTVSAPKVEHDIPLPIVAIFALGPSQTISKIRIAPLSPAEVCMALVGNSFSLNPADLRLAADMLRKAGLVAERIPAFALDYPRDYDNLPSVRATILETIVNQVKVN